MLKPKKKFLLLSSTTLDYREMRFFRTKVAASGVGLALLILALVLAVDLIWKDFLGLKNDELSVLATENAILKEELASMNRKMEGIERGVQRLAQKGNELRLMVDLAGIDEDTRVAAVGGSDELEIATGLTTETAGALASSRQLIDRLEREVKLQQVSYEDVRKRYEYNKEFFSRLPAIKPTVGYYSVNGFGMRIHPVLRVYRMHEGVDIITDVGTNVYATGDGVVRYAGRTQGGYGAVIEISHGYGYSTLYAHLSKVVVRPGQSVKRGELIAKSGRSGLVSGPHLHYEVRRNGRRQNPVDYFFDDVDAARYRTLLANAEGPRSSE